MTKNIGGSRRKARHKLMKSTRHKGKVTITRSMQSFATGQKVHLALESSVHKGGFSTDFIGRTGTVTGKRGKCYEVSIMDGNKEKMIIEHPVHLKESKA